MNLLQSPQSLSEFEARLINRLQRDLPLVESPFALIAEELDCDEEKILKTIESLLERKILTRFGPLYDIGKASGHFTLCALSVPEHRFSEITELVNSYAEVAHNYRREHHFNMWFVLACESEQKAHQVFDEILQRSGCQGINCPKLKEFYVGLYLPAEATEQGDD